MKGKTKIALSTLMTCLIIGNVGFAETVKNIEVGANQEKTYSDSELIVDFTGYQAVKVNGNNAKLQVDSNKISISTKNAGGALLNPSIDGLVAQEGGKVVLGNNNTNSVNNDITIQDGVLIQASTDSTLQFLYTGSVSISRANFFVSVFKVSNL